ncbi:MAG: heavy metal-associated domain-containing protein [Muribaculaceae bacterium]
MKTTINVDNIRCGGCSHSIQKSLKTLTGVFSVEVDISNGIITIEHVDELKREELTAKLLSVGYPEVGTAKGFQAIKAGATSLLSCAIGKITK